MQQQGILLDLLRVHLLIWFCMLHPYYLYYWEFLINEMYRYGSVINPNFKLSGTGDVSQANSSQMEPPNVPYTGDTAIKVSFNKSIGSITDSAKLDCVSSNCIQITKVIIDSLCVWFFI